LKTRSMKDPETVYNLPKIDLHRHLEGSIRISTLTDLVQSEGIDLPADRASLRRIVQVCQDDPKTSENFLSKFKYIRDFYRSPEIIQRIVRETIIDAAEDKVIYLELQFTPFALAQSKDFPLPEVVDWVIDSALQTADQVGIGVGLIASFNRHESMQIAEQVVEVAIDRVGKGIVGLGLSGNEVDFPAEPFVGLFRAAQNAGLEITIHAGEWTGAETVRHAIEQIGARRIGHGIRIMENPEVIALARERRTVFEVCLSSNLQSGVINLIEEHPLPDMIQAGLQVTLNTDDPGVSNICLSDEFRIAMDSLGLTRTTLSALTLVAAQAAFMDPAGKRQLEISLQEKLFS
jgi:adenosine deaminase